MIWVAWIEVYICLGFWGALFGWFWWLGDVVVGNCSNLLSLLGA